MILRGSKSALEFEKPSVAWFWDPSKPDEWGQLGRENHFVVPQGSSLGLDVFSEKRKGELGWSLGLTACVPTRAEFLWAIIWCREKHTVLCPAKSFVLVSLVSFSAK